MCNVFVKLMSDMCIFCSVFTKSFFDTFDTFVVNVNFCHCLIKVAVFTCNSSYCCSAS